MPVANAQIPATSGESPLQSIQSELDETYRGLKEITLMLEQSRVEVNKLSQRNAAITAHLQQIQGNFAKMPPEEVRLAYDSALDAQQRLFVMRGQLDKLQSERTHLEKYRNLLQQSGNAAAVAPTGTAGSATNKNPLGEIEMVVNAQEAERQRLSRQMHDGPAQAMSNFILQT